MKKKILSIVPDRMLKPTGGMGVQFMKIYEKLKDDYEFYVLGFPEDPKPFENYIGVPNIFPIQHAAVVTLYGHSLYALAGMNFPKPDIVHSFDWSTYLAGKLLAEHHKAPLLLTMQLSVRGLERTGIYLVGDESSPDGAAVQAAHREIETGVMRMANHIISVSNSYSDLFEEFKDKTTVIHNGINLDGWIPQKRVKFPGTNPFKVVYIGRFAEMKGIRNLMDAEVPPGIDLILIGSSDGGDSGALSAVESALERKKQNTYYIGPKYDQEKIDCLFSADAVIIPSIHEPFGIVALEALASESVVISTRSDGLSDFLDDSNSIWIDTTPESIERGYQAALSLSREKRYNMLAKGKETCKEFTWDRSVEKYKNVYRKLITES
jgi:glycosyltransferase involved in cell wall biosynthesis